VFIFTKILERTAQWAKPPKNSLKEWVFVNSALKKNTVPYCQKYTPTNCFLGDFAHWVWLMFTFFQRSTQHMIFICECVHISDGTNGINRFELFEKKTRPIRAP